MVRKVNSFEGGVAGSTITAGNSGGDSGDALNTLYVGGGTLTWTDANPLRGTLSGLLSMVASQSYILEWTGFNGGLTSASKSRLGFRMSIRTPATFATGSTVTHIVELRTSVKCAYLKWVSASGIKLGVFDQSSDTVSKALSAFTFAADTEYDIAIWAQTGSTTDTAGTIKAAVYAKGSNTPLESLTVTGAALGTTPMTGVRFGKCNASAQTGDMRMDSVQAGDDFTDLPTFAVAVPTPATTGAKRYAVDASGSTAGGGGTLTYSVAKKSGPDLAVVQRDSLFLFTASTTADAVYTVTVTESGGGSATQDVIIPADTGTAAATGYTELVSLGSGGVWT